MAHRGSPADSLPVVVGRVGPPVSLGLDITQYHVLNRNGQTWHLKGRRGRRERREKRGKRGRERGRKKRGKRGRKREKRENRGKRGKRGKRGRKKREILHFQHTTCHSYK